MAHHTPADFSSRLSYLLGIPFSAIDSLVRSLLHPSKFILYIYSIKSDSLTKFKVGENSEI